MYSEPEEEDEYDRRGNIISESSNLELLFFSEKSSKV
jgi:hypothetical protein